MSEASANFNLGHRKRLREEIFVDPVHAADYKLLELLLTYCIPRRDTKPIAKELLAEFGSLRNVLNAAREDLAKINNLGSASADFFVLLRELRVRCDMAPLTEKTTLCSNDAVTKMARSRLAGLHHEELWIALVDSGLRLLYWGCLSKGGVNAAFVNTQEIVRVCLLHYAYGFILVHNHPGGNSKPSEADIAITLKINAAAEAAGITLLDHLIILDNDYCCMRGENYLPPLSRQNHRR